MGAIGGLTGTAGGANGTGYQAPQQSNVQVGTTAENVQGAQQGTQNSLAAQQNLLNALQGQGGIDYQTNFANQLAAANGVGTQNSAIRGLQGVANQYQNIANGQGPNPAMAMLNQQTGQNIQNQAAMMAGQRGAGANVGLMARQAGQMGGNLQQQAVGQGATMQANQQLNALSGLAAAQQAVGGLGSTQAAQQGSMGNQMVANYMGQGAANANANIANQQSMQNALAARNSANVASQGSVNAGNTSLAQTNMQGQQAMIGGALQGMSGAGVMGASGGEVKYFAAGGLGEDVSSPEEYAAVTKATEPMAQASAPQTAPPAQQQATPMPNPGQMGYGSQQLQQGAQSVTGALWNLAKKGSSGEGAGALMAMLAEGGLADDGGPVEAKSSNQKAIAPGDDYANDKIPAKLSEGEIVLPRSVTMSEDPAKAAAEFVMKTLSERGSSKKNFEGGGKVKDDGKDDEIIDLEKKDLKAAEATPMPNTSAAPEQAPAAAIVPPSDTPPAAATPPQAAAPQPAPAQQPAPPVQQQAAPQTQDPLSPEALMDNHVRLNEDLAAGRVHPKTYQDLFAEKSTLGKIGTVFGVILGGMGSGLTHQPNAAFQVMDRIIADDLNKQMKEKENARNFLSLQYNHNVQQSAIAAQQQDILHKSVDLLNKMGADIDINTEDPRSREMVDELMRKQNEILTPIQVKAQMRDVAAHDLLRKAQASGNPQAINAAQLVKQQVDQANAADLKKGMAATTISAASIARKPKAAQSGGGSPVNDSLLEKAIVRGSRAGETPVKGAIMPSDVPKVREEVKQMKTLHNQLQNYVDTFKKIQGMTGGGESFLGRIGSSFSGPGEVSAIAKGTSNIFKAASERDRDQAITQFQKMTGLDPETIDNIFPGWKDLENEDKKKAAFEAGMKLFKDMQNKTLVTLPSYKKRIPGLYRELPEVKYEPTKGGPKKEDGEKNGFGNKMKSLIDWDSLKSPPKI